MQIHSIHVSTAQKFLSIYHILTDQDSFYYSTKEKTKLILNRKFCQKHKIGCYQPQIVRNDIPSQRRKLLKKIMLSI